MNPFTYILTTNGLLFLLSIIFWKFPPKKINNWYGYRTPKATLNQQIWDFANSIFNKNLVIYAGISFLGGLIFANFATQELTWQPMVLVILSVIVSVIKTERALNDNFTEEGKKKKIK
ncbi:SdpI family protein [Polaribacter sp. L3A8]|uniref:SdpI family protein n=1 Tax=Polaribacter sp. L3A8 TaxID=2686361 RepID=UPI00131AD269|nr:SdpI family protein [Polaribacter sp. L3A8]